MYISYTTYIISTKELKYKLYIAGNYYKPITSISIINTI